jgi:hypothetical protein
MIRVATVLSKSWRTVHEVREVALFEGQQGPSAVLERDMGLGGHETSWLT